MRIDAMIKGLREIQENKEIIFNKIAELYDKIDRGEISTEEILSMLVNIQQYAK